MVALLVLVVIGVVVAVGVLAFGGFAGPRPVVRRRVIVERRTVDPLPPYDSYDRAPRRRRIVEEEI